MNGGAILAHSQNLTSEVGRQNLEGQTLEGAQVKLATIQRSVMGY